MKGLKRTEPIFLATLKEESCHEQTDLPANIQHTLEEFKDVMSLELPKHLSSQWEVDHHIEPEPGTKPLAIVPYQMTPLELEELRKQLKEMLDIGFL